MINLRNKQQSGFTLVELTVTIIIVGILSLFLASFIETWVQASTLSQDRAGLLNNSENAMDTITNDVALSGSAEANNRWADANGPGGNQYGWASSSSTLVLAKVAIDNSNNIIFSDTSEYVSQKDDVIYYLSGTTLYRRTIESSSSNDAATTTCPPADATSTCPADLTVATGVSSLSFGYYNEEGSTDDPTDARSIQVSLTLQKVIDSKTISATYSTRMVFRNE